jgi:hypothetical protein
MVCWLSVVFISGVVSGVYLWRLLSVKCSLSSISGLSLVAVYGGGCKKSLVLVLVYLWRLSLVCASGGCCGGCCGFSVVASGGFKMVSKMVLASASGLSLVAVYGGSMMVSLMVVKMV